VITRLKIRRLRRKAGRLEAKVEKARKLNKQLREKRRV
jgi:hypothetical protein